MKNRNEKILSQSIQYIKSVGPKRAESFRKIGIETIRDILFYFPSRHLDRTTTLTAAKAYGHILSGYDGELTIIAKVEDVEKRRFGKREILKVQFRDQTGFFECTWFQGVKYFASVFHEDDTFAISGKPVKSKYGNLQFTHPDFDRMSEDESRNFLNTGKIIPFYRIPKELRNKNIGDFSLRRIISNAVENFADYLEENLPEKIIKEHNLISIIDAVKNFHYPENKEKLNDARKRFKFEEIFYLELLVALRKYNYKTKLSGPSMEIKTNLVPDFLKTLPFDLTKAQIKVLSEIKKDMLSSSPMNRLLQGDVGSGKTIVALISMLIAIDNDYQAVLMAPTEILADQHAKNISKMMKIFTDISKEREIRVSLLLGGQRNSAKKKKMQNDELQNANIIIGTHALFEEDVNFKNVGLVIVDEQHRFGVAQRAKLRTKGKVPDVLVMSATPIPRTLSMTIYADLDLSIIDEMPKNRKPIKTLLREENKLPAIYKYISDKAREGYQSFIVYPLVEESEKIELKAAETYYTELQNTYLKDVKLGLIHGRMRWQEKEEVMMLFLAKKYDVLISTTVIEVGIDIPDANIILINDAHRFGLSQLHQLRGRVGRGKQQAYCILVTKDEYAAANNHMNFEIEYLSSSQIEKNKAALRLQTMEKFTDGFKVAEIDLKLRGPGDIFGTRQSGFPDLKFIDIINDSDIIKSAKASAFKIINDDPHLQSEKYSLLRENLLKYYSNNLEYAKIA